MITLDATDLTILRTLLSDSCTPKAEIARTVGLTPTAVFERVRKLEERGVIQGYTARLDPRAFGKKLLAFVFVSEVKPTRGENTGERLARLDDVEELHRVTGKDCYLAKVRVADMDALKHVLDRIGSVDTVSDVQTTVVLDTFLEKQWDCLPDSESAANVT